MSESGDYDRDLGVIEAFTAVVEQCPSGKVRRVAEAALETCKREGAGALRDQAYHVLSAIQGWRGDRARQVHRSLSLFLGTPKSERDPS